MADKSGKTDIARHNRHNRNSASITTDEINERHIHRRRGPCVMYLRGDSRLPDSTICYLIIIKQDSD